MLLADRVLAALQGASSQAPLRLTQIVLRLDPDRPPPEADVRAALDDLVGRRALNTCRIVTDPAHLQSVWWPTGIPPQPVPWRAMTTHGHSVADAAAAARTPRVQPSPPAAEPITQETNMPRIKAPAQPRAPRRATPIRPHANQSPLQRAIARALAGLTEATALCAEEIYPRVDSITANVESLRTSLRVLAGRGVLAHAYRQHPETRRTRAHYWVAADESKDTSPQHVGAASPPRPAPPPPTPANRPEDGPPTAFGLLGLQIGPPDDDPLSDLAPPRFLVGDDGDLEIWQGCDLIVRLCQADTMRLDLFLERSQPVIWGEQ